MRSVLLLLPIACSFATAADWPQWRGPGRDSVWTEKLEKLPEELKPRWRTPIGGGYSGIAVADGKVYTLDRLNKPAEVERVVCLDLKTGATLWTHDYAVDYQKMDYGNGPRSTPTVHDGRVYTFGAVGHVHCLDARTGKVEWRLDSVKDLKARVPVWGHACSPLVDDARVVIQVGAPNACLLALDRKSGKEIWRALDDRPGYSSPVIIDAPGGRQLVYWSAEHLSGLEQATGKVLWQVAYTTDNDVTIIDPVWHDGLLIVSDYWKGAKAIRLDERGRDPKSAWTSKRLSLLMSTPLCRDGYLYGLDRHNGLKCVEVKTGNVLWEGEHVTPKDRNPHCSLVWTGDLALILNTPGELTLAELTPKAYRGLGKASVVGKTWATPAFADGCILARTDREIVCVPLAGR